MQLCACSKLVSISRMYYTN